jgi:hypothetical protein
MKNIIEERLIKLLKGKSILFVENSNCLPDVAENLEKMLIKNNIGYQCLFNVQDIGLENTLNICKNIDIIIFHTTWIYSVSKELKNNFMMMKGKTLKKTFIELYVNEPTFTCKPDIIHDLYILNTYFRPIEEWDFYKLRRNKSYWVK